MKLATELEFLIFKNEPADPGRLNPDAPSFLKRFAALALKE
jgi:hypothetical protein